MATIYNSELTNELQEGARIQVSRDKIPSEIAEKVVPVMEVNPKLLKKINLVRSASLTNATSATIFTTATDRDTYLTGLEVSYIKDATSTATDMSVTATEISGIAITLARFAGITLTAANGVTSITFAYPIKLKRNSTVTLSSDTNVANILMRGVVFGFTEENTTA